MENVTLLSNVTSDSVTFWWNASSIAEAHWRYYDYNISYRPYDSNDSWTSDVVHPSAIPIYTLANLVYRSVYLLIITPFRIFGDDREVGVPTNIISLKTGCVGLYTSQQTQDICKTFIQCETNVEDVGPTLYKCFVFCLFFYSHFMCQVS